MRFLASGSSKDKLFLSALLLMGFSGIAAQVLMLRELLILFSGNELTVGIILANWLIIEAAGSFILGRFIERIGRKIEAFVLVQMLFSLSLPLMVYLTRNLRWLLGVVTGEGLGFLPISYSSFLILLPITFTHGALFTFGCKIYSQLSSSSRHARAIGRVYIYETLGTIVGGVSFAYLMFPHLHSFQIAFIITSLNLAWCVLLLIPFWTERFKASIASVSMIFLLFIAYLALTGGVDEIHRFSVDRQWHGQSVIHYQNSIYGNIAVTEEEGQYTFFSDGMPTITLPDPDILFLEEFVHISMLSHPNPRQILVLSGGAGGMINEILKHPTTERVDYAELDPLLLDLLQRFPTPLTQQELGDPKVSVKNVDGRMFVQRTSNQYDLILIGLSNPSDLQVNRMFTEEFFLIARERFKDGAILALTLPGSLTYLVEEMKRLNVCVLNTLKAVFSHIRIVPGDGFNLFLASTSPSITQINASLLSQRLKERELNVKLLIPKHIEYKLHRRWLDWFLNSIEGSEGGINRDFRPLGVFHALAYWNALFSPQFARWFERFGRISLKPIIITIFAFTLIFALLLLRVKKLSISGVPFAIVSSGFSGMLFDLLLIFTFQTLYGYVFYHIGILITVFMLGTAAGSLLITSLLDKIENDTRLFLKLELSIILFACSLPAIFLVFHPLLERPLVSSILQAIFLLLSFISGFLIGSQFPLATKIYLKFSPRVGTTAGLLYGADLIGGWIGGLIGGIILLPVLGLVRTCAIVATIKLSSLIIFAVSSTSSPKK